MKQLFSVIVISESVPVPAGIKRKGISKNPDALKSPLPSMVPTGSPLSPEPEFGATYSHSAVVSLNFSNFPGVKHALLKIVVFITSSTNPFHSDAGKLYPSILFVYFDKFVNLFISLFL